MIETREQFDHFQGVALAELDMPAEWGKRALKTIEALREVAKLLHYRRTYGGSVTFNDKELGKALDALPDWIKEE